MHGRWRLRIVRPDLRGEYVLKDGHPLDHPGTDTEALALARQIAEIHFGSIAHVQAVSVGAPANITNMPGRLIVFVSARYDRRDLDARRRSDARLMAPPPARCGHVCRVPHGGARYRGAGNQYGGGGDPCGADSGGWEKHEALLKGECVRRLRRQRRRPGDRHVADVLRRLVCGGDRRHNRQDLAAELTSIASVQLRRIRGSR